MSHAYKYFNDLPQKSSILLILTRTQFQTNKKGGICLPVNIDFFISKSIFFSNCSIGTIQSLFTNFSLFYHAFLQDIFNLSILNIFSVRLDFSTNVPKMSLSKQHFSIKVAFVQYFFLQLRHVQVHHKNVIWKEKKNE